MKRSDNFEISKMYTVVKKNLAGQSIFKTVNKGGNLYFTQIPKLRLQ